MGNIGLHIMALLNRKVFDLASLPWKLREDDFEARLLVSRDSPYQVRNIKYDGMREHESLLQTTPAVHPKAPQLGGQFQNTGALYNKLRPPNKESK